ncbi:SRPBCC family protein [Lentisalinibacter salinarum]|uniref:SRPBCC family protein n=1 Tax=Lentisalinibacter salinarum TaxID=2992239 RepID=UPI00386A8001
MNEYGEYQVPGCIRFERLLNAPADVVWEYLVDAEKRSRWLAAGEFELRAGGRAEFVFRNGDLCRPGDEPPEKYRSLSAEVRLEGRVLEVNAPSRLVLEWPSDQGPPSIVIFELEARGGETLLTLTETGLAARGDLLGAAAGWHAHLDILEALASSAPPPSFWSNHTRLEAEYGLRLS